MADINSILKILNNDVTFSSCNTINDICKPLCKYGITDFTYIVNFNDRTRIHLSNNTDWSIDFYENFFDLRYTDNVLFEMNLNNYKSAITSEMCDNSVLKDATKKFGVCNSIGLFNKASSHMEIFYFASTHNSKQMINFYLNSLELLRQFQFHFKEQAQKLIKLAQQSNLIIPSQYYEIIKQQNLNINKTMPNDISKFTIKHYQLDSRYRNCRVSEKEVDCIYWCAMGKTAEETAIILNTKKRTIEAHLENVKQKLKCVNKQQLIYKALDLGLINVSTKNI